MGDKAIQEIYYFLKSKQKYVVVLQNTHFFSKIKDFHKLFDQIVYFARKSDLDEDLGLQLEKLNDYYSLQNFLLNMNQLEPKIPIDLRLHYFDSISKK